jgi:hypothetical protein
LQKTSVKKVSVITLLILGITGFISLMTGCQTGKVKPLPVSPFSFLQEKEDFYFSINVKGNESLLKSLLLHFIPEINTDFVDEILNRTEAVYGCFTLSSKDKNGYPLFQFVIQDNFPKTMVSTALNLNKAWIPSKLLVEGKKEKIFSLDQTEVALYIPKVDLLFLSNTNIDRMISAYKSNNPLSVLDSITEEKLLESYLPTMYLTSPGQSIPALLGLNNIELAIDNAFATITIDQENANIYKLKIDLQMSDEKAFTAGLIMLKLASKFNSFIVIKEENNRIIIDNFTYSL